MIYNLSQLTVNGSDLLSIIQAVNSQLLYGILGTLFLVAIGTVFYVGFYAATNNSKKAIAGTCFIVFGLAILLRTASLVNDFALYVTLILCAASAVLIGLDR